MPSPNMINPFDQMYRAKPTPTARLSVHPSVLALGIGAGANFWQTGAVSFDTAVCSVVGLLGGFVTGAAAKFLVQTNSPTLNKWIATAAIFGGALVAGHATTNYLQQHPMHVDQLVKAAEAISDTAPVRFLKETSGSVIRAVVPPQNTKG